MFVAGADAGEVAYSTDGQTWTAGQGVDGYKFNRIVYGSAGIDSSLEEVKFH
jgi:hypothetical protein